MEKDWGVQPAGWNLSTPSGVCPNSKGTWSTLLLVCQSNGVHYPVRLLLLGEGLSLQLLTITDKELI